MSAGREILARALEGVRAHEGGYSDDRADPGGQTNWGISLRFLESLDELGDIDRDGDIDADDVRQLTWPAAAALYTRHFWDRYRYELLPDTVAVKMLDLAVNVGPSQAHRILQRALRACLETVDEDGVLGRQTIQAASRVPVPGTLLASIRSEAAGFYRLLVAARPEREKYLVGWLNRAYS